MMMFIRYVGMISKKKISYTVYYGMFDARQGNATPLVNLTTISELTEWINAISEFRSFGSVKKLYQCLEMEKNENNTEAVNEIIAEIQHFDYALNSNNLYYLENGIRYIINLNVASLPLSSQAKLMLTDLSEDFTSRFVDETAMYPHARILVKLSQLFTEQGRYGAAAVSIQESIITYIMERYVCTYIMERENLSKEQYEQYMQQYDKRRPVKEHFDRKVTAYMNRKYKGRSVSSDMIEFMQLYLNIKKYIRNVDAHIIPQKIEGFTSDEMEKWLNRSIQFLLKDMNSFLPKGREGFSALYEDFVIEEDPVENRKVVSEFIKGTSDGKWNLINENKPELSADINSRLTAAEIDIGKIQELRKELLYVKEKGERNKAFTLEDLQKNVLVCEILCMWVKADKQKKEEPKKSELLQYLKTKTDVKGRRKNAYERLEAAMKNNLSQKVVNILTK